MEDTDKGALRTGNATRDVLLALAERCEREEPGEVLDGAIAEAIRGHHRWPWLPYTTSLDAAVTLVPEGHVWRAGAGMTGYADVAKRGIGYEPRGGHTWAKTPALALCAAALRARAALEGGKDE